MTPRAIQASRIDFAALARLHATAFDLALSAGAIGELLCSAGAFGFVIGEDKEPEGLIVARLAADEAEILTLAVSPQRRRRGLGRALVEAAAAHAEQSGGRALFLEVDASNAAARLLYEKLGFAAVGKRTSYYAQRQGPARDAVILKSALPIGGKCP